MKFTPENAREWQAKGVEARKLRRDNAEFDAVTLLSNDDDLRKGRVLRQIDLLDRMIEEAEDANTVCKLMAAKDRAWSMVMPKQAPVKQRGSNRRSAPPTASDV